MKIEKILSDFPFRISLTNHCNSNCFFCSNEGMPVAYKNNKEIDLENLTWIIETLSENGLKNIALTGGEPILYSKLDKLLNVLAQHKYDNLFFHTNGFLLNEKIADRLIESGFTKIAVSLHSTKYQTWHRITQGTISQFRQLIKNIKSLKDKKVTIEIKQVIVKGVNDSPKDLEETLDFCAENHFKLKILNLEPINNNQIILKDELGKIKKLLKQLGCKNFKLDSEFRGQKNYLPIHYFEYKNTKGVLIDLLCGKPVGCNNCYKSNEIFLTPKLTLKPCHMTNFELDIKPSCKKKDEAGLINQVIESRKYLKTKPGIGKRFWSENNEQSSGN